MPDVVVDLSACSVHIREELWHLHFWENTAVSMYAHRVEDIGRHQKELLHSPEEEQVGKARGEGRSFRE